MSGVSLVAWVILLGGLGTFAWRYSFLALGGSTAEEGLLDRALRMVPTAVLSAVVLPVLTVRGPGLADPLGQARLLAALVAALTAWRTQSVIGTIVVGMVTLWLAQAALG